MDIARVDPVAVAEDVSLILREAWPPPVLHYSADYIRWQFSFPGPAPRGILAREASEPAAFIGWSPRRLRFGGASFYGAQFSFLGVRPRFAGRGLASELYFEAMADLRAAGLPSLVYVEAHSGPAQRLLLKTVERLNYKSKRLAPCVNHGFLLRAGAAPIAATAGPANDLAAVLEVIDACAAGNILFSVPDRAQLEHYLRDPRSRQLLLVEEGGRAVGAAMVFLSEIVTAQGMERVSTVDTLFLPEPTSDRLAAVARAAATAFAGRTTASTVSIPNLVALPPELIKAAGLRRTGAAYENVVLHGEGHACLDAEATNLEVA